MPEYVDATAMLADVLRYGEGMSEMVVDNEAWDEMRHTGRYTLNTTGNIHRLEYVHPFGRVDIYAQREVQLR